MNATARNIIENQKYDFVYSSPLAKCLDKNELETIMKTGEVFTLEKHDVIFQQGDISDKLFFLLDGVVKIAYSNFDGREMIKSILHQGAIFGEHCIAGEEIRDNYSSVMSSTASVMAVDKKIILGMIQKNTGLSLCIINFFSKRLKDTEERLESLILQDARERIVEFIKLYANAYGKQVGYELLLKHSFTQQDIANYTGVSRQTVTTVLNQLKRSNKIHFRGKSMLIRNIAALS
jgi:CRP/FNR family transcriptional regulator, cyclic AMP receptor protein